MPAQVTRFLSMSLEEDLGPGDITSALLLTGNQRSKAVFTAKSGFILAGLPFAQEVFRLVDGGIKFKPLLKEGSKVQKGAVLAEITGQAASLLAAERVSLNILQHLCGIATLTNSYVQAIKEFLPSTKIVDTRKTMPSMRYMEKYAVRMGGGGNHRFGLYDGILIKDNHIKAAGGIKKAVALAKKGGMHHLLKIEIEVEDLKGLKDALEAGADVIMLDNMSIPMMEQAVKLCKKGKKDKTVLLEASGNVTLENVRSIAQTGVDLISSGSITHSAPAADISMRII